MLRSCSRPSSMDMVGSSRTTLPGQHHDCDHTQKLMQNLYQSMTTESSLFLDWPMSTSSCERCLSFRWDITQVTFSARENYICVEEKRHQRWNINFEIKLKRLLQTQNKSLKLAPNFSSKLIYFKKEKESIFIFVLLLYIDLHRELQFSVQPLEWEYCHK